MKKLIALLMFLFVSNAFADCDWSKGITAGPNKTYIYSEACHLSVGQLIQTNKTQAAQLIDLQKAFTLQTKALSDSDARVQLWMSTSLKMEDSLTTYDALKSKNEWLFFALGVVATAAGAYTFNQINHH